MHVFLDTTLMFNDPFFKTLTNKGLIDMIRETDGRLYMSRVVYEETKQKLVTNIVDKLNKVNNGLKDLNKHLSAESEFDLDRPVDSYLMDLVKFYEELISEGNLIILEHNQHDGLLDEVITRSIQGKKPFGKRKQEFRDCITWLTYAKFVEGVMLNDCYFISNNTSDFFDVNLKDLHEDLLEDTKRLKPYIDAKTFLSSEKEKISKLRSIQDTFLWFEQQDLTEEKLLPILEHHYFRKILSEVTYFINNMSGEELSKCVDENAFDYDIEYGDSSTINIDDVIYYEDIDIAEDGVLLAGVAEVISEVALYTYNGFRDNREDDRFVLMGSSEVNLEVSFAFKLLKSGGTGDEIELFLEAVKNITHIRRATESDVDQF